MKGPKTIILWLVVAAVACGDRGSREPQHFDPFASIQPGHDTDHVAPRWEKLVTLEGSRATSRDIDVETGAIQWRARWTCTSGPFGLTLGDDPTAPPVETDCPDQGDAYSIETGTIRLDVEAVAEWGIVIEQQVVTPLHEPPLAAMSSPEAQVVARGDFYGIERDGYGTLALYRLSDGRLAMRFEGFATAPDTELVVWLSEAERPATTQQAFEAPYVEIAPLKSTGGDQNYLLPRDVDLDRWKSVVIWCPIRIAYAAAALER